MGGQLTTGSSIYMASAGVPAADGAGLSSIKSFSQLLTSIAAMPLAGGTFTGNVLFTDNTYDIGASGATRPRTVYAGTSVITPLVNNASAALTLGNSTYGVTVPGAATVSGDISMQKATQGYVYAYSTGGVRNTRFYHDNSNGWIESSYGDLVLNSADGDVYAFKSGTNSTLGAYNSDGSRSVLLNPTTVPAVVGSTNLYAIATNGAVVLQGSAGSVQVFKSGSNCTVDVYDSGVTKYTRLTHDGTNGILSTSSGNLNLVPTGGTVAVTGGITASGVVSHGAYTVATLPSAASNAGKMAQVTDSNVAASGNYGATVAAGGANRVKVFSDGTNWVIA